MFWQLNKRTTLLKRLAHARGIFLYLAQLPVHLGCCAYLHPAIKEAATSLWMPILPMIQDRGIVIAIVCILSAFAIILDQLHR